MRFTTEQLAANPRYSHLVTGQPAERKPSKHHNVLVDSPDGVFHSKAEHAQWLRLKFVQKNGGITGLMRQVRFALWTKNPKTGAKLHDSDYIADFVYLEIPEGRFIVEDSKGMRTREYLRKKRLMRELYGIDIVET